MNPILSPLSAGRNSFLITPIFFDCVSNLNSDEMIIMKRLMIFVVLVSLCLSVANADGTGLSRYVNPFM